MSAEEIQLFNHSIAYHQPVAIGSFLLFAIIYRSKFYNYKSPSIINLPSSASEIISIRLLENTKEFSDLYSQDEVDNILFDNIYLMIYY